MRRVWRGSLDSQAIAAFLRKRETPAEALLWSKLRAKALGVKFRRQHPVGGFIADFYAPSAALIIEVDGSVHDQRRELDAAREDELKARGLRIVRFSNDAVTGTLDEVIADIKTALRS